MECDVFQLARIIPVLFSPMGLSWTFMSTRKLGNIKIRFSTPQERLIVKLSSNEARTSEKFVPRPSIRQFLSKYDDRGTEAELAQNWVQNCLRG